MARAKTYANRVNIIKMIKIDGKWPFAPVVERKGRIVRDHVLVDGKDEYHPEGRYYSRATAAASPNHLHGVYGARGRQHFRHDSSYREKIPRRRYQLGPGSGQDPDLPAVGLVAEALCKHAAYNLVSRRLSHRRHALPTA